MHDEQELRRPLAMILLGGLYLFFFLLTVSTYGHPAPFFGTIYHGTAAGVLVFLDSLLCLYLFLGLMKRQSLTWYLLLGYNAFEVVNTLTNMLLITPAELEKIVGEKVDTSGLVTSNISVIVAIILLSGFIFRQRASFTNRSKYLF
ncbi:MAG: hypothetical protein A2076_16760 [Geobacteraceae bacterium GWC2_53_11]|nr:MAG: hypothetical protein A2076_16760 [Geobacteraceae bacterium GWC2_53_11]